MEIGINTSDRGRAADVLEAMAEALREGVLSEGEGVVDGVFTYVDLGNIPKVASGENSALDRPPSRGDIRYGLNAPSSFFGSEKPLTGTYIKRTSEEGETAKTKTKKKASKTARIEADTAEAIYAIYPRKVGKKAALKAIQKALREVDPETLLQQVQRFAAIVAGKEAQYVPHPATWFNQGRWEDEELSTPLAAPTTPAAGLQGPRVDVGGSEAANSFDADDVEW